METVQYIWMDGELIPWDKAQIHVLTHSLHYGSAVFEGLRFYKTDQGPAVFRLTDHLKRLFYSASILKMNMPFSLEQLKDAIHLLIRENAISDGYIRPIAYFGYGKMGLNPLGAPPCIAIALWPWGAYLGTDMVKVKISSYIRIHPKSLITDAKISGHYVNSILPSLEAHESGFDEAILLDFEGNVAEGPGENVFVVKNGRLFTPQTGNILPGITRDSVFVIAKDMGIPVEEKNISVSDLKNADELFFTGTACEVTGIEAIDDNVIGDGTIFKITTKIRRTFLDAVKGKLEKYRSWLDVVI
ncbi:branched-chain amino acid transaminase [Candidatus Peregrinibacteria bacterium]|nr:branched-chain amino acid transaminase [Candidatus Peregrinibacteria bacterium]